jgi:diguanylate cyclase (GGDEF)-like protein
MPTFPSLFSGFRQQLVLTFSAGIVLLATLTSIAISHFSTKTVQQTLIRQGLQATGTLATQSTLALLYQSADNAQGPAEATLAFPDVLGVAVYDLEGKPVLSMGHGARLPPQTASVSSGPTLTEEGPDAWYFIAPVLAGEESNEDESPFVTDSAEPELLGYVGITMGKQTLNAMARDILRSNLIVSTALASGLLVLLLAITARVTRPVKTLAQQMHRAQLGEGNIRAELKGPKEIVEMATAFNTMMGVLEDREQALKRARDAALESANAKGEFAANVSHELRTPMNGILGMLELLQDMGLTSKQSEYLGVARKSAESLLVLIDDILDFSRVESGSLKLRPEDFYLQDVLDDVVSILSGQAQRKDLDLGYVIEQYVPSALRGEPRRIRQVLINLAGNAIKFTERGEVAIEVRVVEEVDGRVLMRFEVTDTGIGIAPEAQKRIFEAFAQADGSTTRRYGGTGLGLAISRQIVGFLGGEIDVKSEPGKGSTFWFEIPLEIPENKPERTETRRDEVTGLRVLIVDDSGVNRSFLEKTFASWGMYQHTASDGPQALEMLRQAALQGRAFDLAVVDEVMPGMQGQELTRQIKADPEISEVKVILMTTRRQKGLQDARRIGIASVVSKPVRQSLLFDCISTITKTPLASVPGSGLPRSEPEEPEAPRCPGGRILVAEDNRANQQVAVGMLERLGCEVDVVSTGRDALEAAARTPYDLILMDCQMPEMDGYDATKQIRGLESSDGRIPIIAMTANVQDGDSDKCLHAGMDDYMAKPLKLDMLREKLQRWLTIPESHSSSGGRQAAPEPTDGSTAVREEPLHYEAFTELRESIGEAFPKMIELFLEDLPVYLNTLAKAVAESNAKALADAAHSIKGSARNFGADRLALIAKRLEDLGRSAGTEGAGKLLKELESESEAVMALLQHEVRPDNGKQLSDSEATARILVVDDDRGMRLGLRQVLEMDGYRVEEASNGLQALELCERHMPDLVLMDAMMPVLDGFAACARMRELPGGNHMPVLIITALDDERSIESAFTAGAIDYIPKPVHFAVLRQRIARLVQASRAEQHVRHLAYNDPLTGLPNRSMFMEQLGSLLNRVRRKGQMMAILFLDLDRFKMVNDTLGHDVGDLLLKAVAERINRCVRSGDLVARLGGDEFTIILDNISTHKVAASVAEKICHALAEPFTFIGQEMYVSTSIGISLCPQDGADIGSLMKHADTAMFKAKDRGGQYQFYETGMEAAVSKQLELQNDLRRALEREELSVHYQPQADLGSGKIIGMEALVRWQHPTNGYIPPNEFIPLAEETGLIHEVGKWVLRRACRQTQHWLEQGFGPLRVSVNLSGIQLERADCAEHVAAVLNETGLSPDHLELEITESTIMEHPEDVVSTLDDLKQMGITLAIDDFGTGYSSLSYLKRFPIDLLKIDASFVRDITTDPDDKALISGIIALAKSLRLQVIAEGVETHDQKTFLQEQGCDQMQGYYLSKPLPAQVFEEQILRKIKEGGLSLGTVTPFRQKGKPA